MAALQVASSSRQSWASPSPVASIATVSSAGTAQTAPRDPGGPRHRGRRDAGAAPRALVRLPISGLGGGRPVTSRACHSRGSPGGRYGKPGRAGSRGAADAARRATVAASGGPRRAPVMWDRTRDRRAAPPAGVAAWAHDRRCRPPLRGPPPRRLRPRAQRDLSGLLTTPDPFCLGRAPRRLSRHRCPARSAGPAAAPRVARGTAADNGGRRDGGQQHPGPSR